jgi:predicted MFS family arabinose efflux permease
MGGYMTQYISWRWVFWATSIFDGAVQIVSFVLLKETHHPTILKKKVMAMRKSTGNEALHTKWQGPDHSMKKILMKSLIRPFIMLTTQPALQAMALFRGFQYGIMYLVFSTIPGVFEGSYNQDVGRASLNYLSLGVGFVIGLQISGRMQDKVCKVGTLFWLAIVDILF